MDGVSLTEYLTCYLAHIAVIALSSYSHREMLENILACGVKGYVFKACMMYINNNSNGDALPLLHEAINAVSNCEYYIDANILRQEDFTNVPP
ncbi:MAG: hypothetical protein QM541_00900 [Flavobacterium sp.]|nr:hypothetical protein [Flavobacterium sp.]